MTRALPGGSPPKSPRRRAKTSAKLCQDGAIASDVVRKMIGDEAAGQNVDVKLAVTIAAQESNFGALVNSPAAAAAGAMGVMQLTGRDRRSLCRHRPLRRRLRTYGEASPTSGISSANLAATSS